MFGSSQQRQLLSNNNRTKDFRSISSLCCTAYLPVSNSIRESGTFTYFSELESAKESFIYKQNTSEKEKRSALVAVSFSCVFFHSSIPTGKGIRFICMRKELTLSFVESILLCRIELASSLILLILLHHTYSYSIQ